MKLFICEKPSQARDIAAVLGDFKKEEGYLQGKDFQVTWCLGHLLEQAPPDDYCKNLKPWRMSVLPVIPDEWKMQAKPKTKKQLTVIKNLLKKVKHVVIATDADREGDVIGREVLDFFDFKGKVERLWLAALDESSIKKALNDIRPGSSTENLYQAGLGRQRADWLIGMNLTMAASSLFGVRGQGVLSVGRVQTPTLKLVVDRDEQFENFKAKDYFELSTTFSGDSGEVIAKLVPPDDISDDNKQVINKGEIDAIKKAINAQEASVIDYKSQLKNTAAPLCYSLSELQKAASSQFGFGAKETLDLAQSLYETHKATTYPRTDCGYLPTSQIAEIPTVFKAMHNAEPELGGILSKADQSFKSKVWNDKKITAHHGIIPTMNPNVSLNSMSDKERKLFKLIRNAYIAQFLGDYQYLSQKIVIECCQYQFKASGNTSKVLGWREVMQLEKSELENDENKDKAIAEYQVGCELQAKSSSIQNKKTKPLPRFNEGSLISTMKSIAKYIDDPSLKHMLKETAGIGTEATRANIIEILIKREFIAKKGKQIISTERGRELIALLPESITSPATTAIWEQQLESIACGEGELEDFFDDQTDALEGILNQLAELSKLKGNSCQSSEHDCPECEAPLIRRKGKKAYWWGCSAYPKCKFTAFDAKGVPMIKINL